MKKPAFDPTKSFEPVKPSFDSSKPFDVIPSESNQPTDLEKAETFARSTAEGITAGASEPVISGTTAVVRDLLDQGISAEILKDFWGLTIDRAELERRSEGLGKKYQEDVKRRRALKQALPGYSIAGEIFGSLLPISAPAKIAKAASASVKGLGTIPKVGGITKSAAEAALGAAGMEAAKQAVEVPTGFIKPEEQPSILETAEFGAKVGGGLAAAGPVVRDAFRLGKAGLKAGLGVLLGPTQKTIEKYLADPDTLKRAKSPAQIKALVDQTVSKVQDDIRAGQLSVEKAKEVLDTAKSRYSDVVQTKKADISDAFSDARQKLQIAKEEALRPIREAKPPAELKQDVLDAASEIKKRVGQESEQSYKILDEMQAMVKRGKAPPANLGDIPDRIKAIQNTLRIGNKVSPDEESRSAFRLLNDYREKWGHLWKENVAWPQVKQIVQAIDRDIRKFSDRQNPAQFSDLKVQKLMELRSNVDNLVKTTSDEVGLGYRSQMARVASLRELQNKMDTFIGREQTLQGKLDGIWRPSKSEDVKILTEIGEQVGIDLGTPIKGYIKTKAMAMNPRAVQEVVEQLPESSALRKLEQTRKMIRRPGGEEMLAPAQTRAVQTAEVRLELARRSAEEAQKALQDLGVFARVDSNINAIKTAVAERNPQFDVYLKNLTKASGQDFVQMIDDLRVAEGFAKDFTHGSRRVNLFGAIGAGVFGLATQDPIAMAVATGLGAAAGGMMDRFGGKMAQIALDGVLKVKGIPTVQKMNEALSGLPSELKDYILQDLVRSATVIRNENIRIDLNQQSQIYNDVKNSKLDAVSKSKALEQMEKTGTINSDTIKKIMLDERPTVNAKVPDSKRSLEADRPDVLRRR